MQHWLFQWVRRFDLEWLKGSETKEYTFKWVRYKDGKKLWNLENCCLRSLKNNNNKKDSLALWKQNLKVEVWDLCVSSTLMMPPNEVPTVCCISTWIWMHEYAVVANRKKISCFHSEYSVSKINFTLNSAWFPRSPLGRRLSWTRRACCDIWTCQDLGARVCRRRLCDESRTDVSEAAFRVLFNYCLIVQSSLIQVRRDFMSYII